MTRHSSTHGFTLVELLIAMLMAGMLSSASLRLAGVIHAGWRHQQALSGLNHDARVAFATLRSHIEPAGFSDSPWDPFEAITADSTDAISVFSDRLVVQRWSRRNCFELENPDRDAGGAPRAYVLEAAFWVPLRPRPGHAGDAARWPWRN